MLDGTVSSPDLLGALARQHTARCIAKLAEVLDGDDPGAAVEAARELLSRGHGQAPMTIAFDGSNITVEVAAGTETQEPAHHSNGDGSTTWKTR